ncbi:glycosyl transferase family 1 [Mycolicibacterium chubuense]|uniref:Capsular glucan synthase n=1 Tax=Mycolicibacterium chubuense TaxID=1800 RepID=A0A0J6WJ43_MYCCU|nr:glycosyltransferase family 1 protein [Mycolicibacterium chubuense]KMO83355.1 Capsular glucan synthase [Mycolicibacterium chubuense]ORA47670.1 glycosyl transferase family 1 [Mycolicibacterium chubuense]SPY00391.1 glycosyltransferase [Mycolicibacterium chubuense]
MTDRRVDLLFDARHLRQSGIGTYIATLLPSLEDTFAERGLSLALLVNEHAVPEVRPGTTVVTAPPAAMYTLGEQRVWARALNDVRPRGFWVPHYPFPFAALRHRGTRLFVTVHDTMHVRDREISGQSAARRAYARTMFQLDGRLASLIFTPSEATKATLTAMSPGARVTVTPIPVDEEWFAPVDPGLSPVQAPYVLYIGNAKWHKNLPLLLMAFGDVAGDVPHKLVIAGSGEALRGGDERVPALAAGLGERVEVMGRLDFPVLRSLVAGADLLVMPSLYEGAGLPPIEAMASHTAVLASDIPALRETCGGGADYFDPTDRAELAAALRAFCRDEDARAKLAARGWAHVTARQAGLSLAPAAEAVAEVLGSSTGT